MNRDDFCGLSWGQVNCISDCYFSAIWGNESFAMANRLNRKTIKQNATILSHVTQPGA
jgi:hypothetical protein